MNKLSKRVLSLLLALLMVLGTCDQALAAGLDNGRYTEDSVTELPEPTPEPTAEPTPEPTKLPDDPEPTELPENPEPTELPENPEPTELPENPEPTELPENPEPTEKPVVEGEEAVDVAYSDKSEGEYTVAVAEGSYSSDGDVPVLKSVSVTPVEGRTVLEGWTISGNGKDLKLTVSIKTMPALEEGETLALVALNGSVQSSQLKVVTGEGDFASVTVSDSTTGIGLVKVAASAAEETPAEKTIETKEQTLPAGNVSINGFLPVGGSVTAVKQGAAKPQMVLKSVNRAASTQSTTSAPAANEKVLASYDITILDENGESWQPEKAVTVTITDDSFGDGKTLQIYHQGSSGREFVATVTSHNNTVSFPAEHFSVYVVVESVVPRLTVNFVSKGTTVETAIVKAADTDDEIADIIADPSNKVVLGENEVFRGWIANKPNYTVEDIENAMSVSAIRSDAKSRAGALSGEDGTVTYYALVYKVYHVTYKGEFENPTADVFRGTHEILFHYNDSAEYQNYTVNMPAQGDSTHNFEGWLVNDGGSNIKDYTEGKLYPNGTSIQIKGDVVFGISAPKGVWLVFDEVEKGATYCAPKFIKSGDVTEQPRPDSEMLLNGYTFGGWFDTKEHAANLDSQEGKFTFESTLAEGTTLYARWSPKSNADYTVIVWKQSVLGVDEEGDKVYDFAGSYLVKDAVTKVAPSAVSVNSQGVVTITGTEGGNVTVRPDTGFHYASNDQNAVIDGDPKVVKPDGSTVVNVYFDRTEYTLTFQDEVYTYTATTSNNGTQYGVVGGQYVQLTRYSGSWYYYDYGWQQYSGIRYTRTGPTWTTIKEVKALYGQNIRNNFPIVGSNGVTYDGASWQSQGSSIFDNEAYVSFINDMQAESTTFRLAYNPTGTYYTYHVKYYVEALPGAANPVTFDGKQFTLFKDVEIHFESPDLYSTKSEEFTDLTGYSQYKSNPAYDEQGRANFDSNRTISLYYLRNVYDINFLNGAYYDGRGNRTDEAAHNPVANAVKNVPYGADVSSYDEFKLDAEPTGLQYSFAGWYTDKLCTVPYDFTTMPVDGITVYAKWIIHEYRVFLHPQATLPSGGNDNTLNWGSDSQAMNFRIASGGKLNAPMGTRTGYEFDGWFLDAAGTSLFSDKAFVLNDTTVTTPYDKTVDMTDPMNKFGEGATWNSDITGYNGGDRFWITKKLDLYGKWHATTEGAKGITVQYVVNGNDIWKTDANTYIDTATASAFTAPTAPEGQRFSHWVIETWTGDDDTGSYQPTDRTVEAGATFTVLKSDAHRVIQGVEGVGWHWKQAVDESGNLVFDDDGNPVHAVDDQGNKIKVIDNATYTVQLRAVFVPIKEAKPTHIDWYMNDGTDTKVRSDGTGSDPYKTLKINEAVNIPDAPTRTGYTFKGWAKSATATTPWLTYSDGAYTNNGNTVTQVAADEKTPIEDLYAVWEENDVTINYAVASDSTGRGTVDPTSETIKAATGTAAGSTATASSNTYIIDYWTCDDGTEHVGDEAKFTPSKNANGIYEAHTYYAHFKLNEATVTIHHYLKGTTTPVADDVTTQETIGTEYTAQPVTTYQGKNLTVDSYNPTQPVTIEAEGNVITIYYTLPLTITAKTDSKEYDGSKLTGSFSYDGALDSDMATIEGAFGAPLEIGPNVTPATSYQARTTGIPGYYAITNNPGTLTITPNTDKVTVTITGNHESKVYNAAEQSVTGYTTDVGEKTITVELKTEGKDTAKGTNVGHYDMGLTKDDFTVTSDNYSNIEVVVVDGYLDITPITEEYEITVTGNSDTQVYNGSEQSVNGYTVSEYDSTITFTGIAQDDAKATAKGTNVGTYTMTMTKDDFSATSTNYTNIKITVVPGTLTITPITDKVTVTITENNGSEKYDGSEKTVTGYTVSIDNELYTEADFEFKGDATVKGTDAGTYNMELKPEDFANTSNNFSNVEFVIVDGTLEIAKRTVTLTSAADKKVYDGTALTNDEVTVGGDGFATGEGAAYDVTGTQTLVGSSANTFTYTLNEGTKAANYDITTTEGKLTVTDGTNPDDPKPVDDDKVVTKTDGKENDGKKYHVGETIEWTIWVKNIYDAEKTLTVTETEGMTITSEVPEKLAAGKEITITVQHVVTAADVVAGSIKNEVKVKLGDLEKTGDDTVETEKIKITVTAASQTKQYDGTALTNGTFTVTPADPEVPVADGHTVRATVTGSQTEVGSSANVISDYKVTQAVPELDEEGKETGNMIDVDVSDAYEITPANGTLTVTTVPYTINYVFTWPGGAAPAGAPNPPAAATVNRGTNYTVSTATYADIPYGIAPNGNVITVLRFQGWDTTGTINNVRSNRTITGAWTIQMVWYTVTYTDGVPGEVIFPDQVTTTLRIGANTPAFNGTPTREGFNFTGWAPAVSPTVTGNNVYTAQWAPIEEERIVEPTPEPTPVVEEEIIDEEVPQAAPGAAWALINLLAALGTVATAVGMIITFFKKKDDDDDGTKANPDEESDENKGKKSKFLGLIPAVASVIIFILTENMHNPMTLVDKWTIPMVLILAANGIVAYLTRNKKPEDEDTEKAAG